MKIAWFQRTGVWVGGLLAATALNALLFSLLRPEKRISFVFTSKQYRWMLVGLIIGGILLAVSDIVFPD
jgi:formate-dependent nitrite reductase membrane component NrfD